MPEAEKVKVAPLSDELVAFSAVLASASAFAFASASVALASATSTLASAATAFKSLAAALALAAAVASSAAASCCARVQRRGSGVLVQIRPINECRRCECPGGVAAPG